MTRYLLDTNHLSACFRSAELVTMIRARNGAGDRLGVCVPVLCELEVGILGLSKPHQARSMLNDLMVFLRTWPIEPSLMPFYSAAANETRTIGRVLSLVDLMLAALSRQHGFILLTTDCDFEALPDVKTENWLA